MLRPSEEPLAVRHDVFMLDLDGVVYIGEHAVPGVSEHLDGVRAHGAQVAFVTNNASRPPQVVADHLRRLGVGASAADVVTSAQAAASVLHGRYGAGARILVLGSAGLDEALGELGLVAVHDVEDADVRALVTGYGPDVVWRDILACAIRVRGGLDWVASNTDMSFPTAMGLAPGHGVLVKLISDFADVSPTVAGKPSAPLLEVTVQRCGAQRPLMVGDRLDTDIAGGNNAGIDTLLVLTGVTGLPELVAAAPVERPQHISATLSGALEPHGVPVLHGDSYALGGWRGRVEDGDLVVDGEGVVDDWWRVVASTSWAHLDVTGEVVALHRVRPPHESVPSHR